ncbi:MAG: transcriptional regulator GcvA [Proteobacteria bacterium]|nr:transcriptional regulator GcvA [Pseudomonadota bacterium]
MSEKTRRLPPLNSLRAFAAAAERLSLAAAAEDLHVTPSAVSLQIRQLEDHLGIPVFIRTGRGLQLTNEGKAILPGILEGFDQLRMALSLLGPKSDENILTLSVAPSFAAKWLSPRLDAFAQAHPQIDVRILATDQLVDFAVDDVDIAIRYGSGVYPGVTSEHLLAERVFPVCAPQLLETVGHPQDLLRSHTLLHDDSPDQDKTCPDWRMWLRAARVSGVDWRRGPRFNQSSLVLEAAVAGRGIALAKATLAEADLAAGKLTRLAEIDQPIEFAYYLVYPAERRQLPKCAAFREWIMTEARGPVGASTR